MGCRGKCCTERIITWDNLESCDDSLKVDLVVSSDALSLHPEDEQMMKNLTNKVREETRQVLRRIQRFVDVEKKNGVSHKDRELKDKCKKAGLKRKLAREKKHKSRDLS